MSSRIFGALRRVSRRSLAPILKPSPISTQNRRFLFSFGSKKELDVEAESRSLHNSVLGPLNSKLLGPLEKFSDQLTPMPLVFVLGNHSSGKSTFINHIIRREVQTTGVAPTDDSFTVIVPGKEDVDQNGPSLIGDPDLGFGGLRQFGTALISHVAMKVRGGLGINNLMIVDSPGMIDSPINSGIGGARNAGDFGVGAMSSPRDRGYNFPGVVRWFAERADVILLFFDPDKPGTTGETLACMTHSLMGLDHKVHIILNKVDQFTQVHDYARSYGSLCWNLSKVIPRKDLPRIYTMCVPTKQSGVAPALTEALGDMEAARKEITDVVFSAPLRRMDNIITRLYDNTRLLKMHAQIGEAVRKEFKTLQVKWAALSLVALALPGSFGASMAITGLWEAAAPFLGVSIAAAAGTWWYGQKLLADKTEYFLERGGLDDTFRRVHYIQLAENDDFIVSLWERVKPQLFISLRTLKISGLPAVKSSEFHELDRILDKDIPHFRRLASKAGAFITPVIGDEFSQLK